MKSRNKNIILGFGFFIILVVCYMLAFSKTLSLQKTYESLKDENILFENIPKQQYSLNRQNQYLDSLLDKYQIGGTSLQNNLLKCLNANADTLGFKLVAFNKAHEFKKEQLTINSHDFIVEGNFNKLLHLLYNFEQKTKFGEVVHAHFEKKKDIRTRKEYLEAEIIIQNYK